MNRLQEEIDVRVHCGVHGRIAGCLATVVRCHQVTVILRHGGQQADCRSILEILALGLTAGSRVMVEVEGSEATEVLKAVRSILAGEEPC